MKNFVHQNRPAARRAGDARLRRVPHPQGPAATSQAAAAGQPARNPFGQTIAGSGDRRIAVREHRHRLGTAGRGARGLSFPSDDVGKQVAAGRPAVPRRRPAAQSPACLPAGELAAAEAQLAKLDNMPRPEEIPPAEARVKAAEAERLRERRTSSIGRQKLSSGNARSASRSTTPSSGLTKRPCSNADKPRPNCALLKAGAWEPDKAIARATVAQIQAADRRNPRSTSTGLSSARRSPAACCR